MPEALTDELEERRKEKVRFGVRMRLLWVVERVVYGMSVRR